MNPGGPAPPVVPAFVGVGSNVEPERHLLLACRELRARHGPLLVSSVYRSAPVGFKGADFLNLVIGLRTGEPAAALVAGLERVHALAGRVRGPDRFAPRTLDLDLLLYGDAVIDAPPVRVPHADILRYGFVLGPLAEIAPELRHPVDGRTMAELWAAFDRDRHPMARVTLSFD